MARTQDDIDNLTPVVPSRLDPSQFEIVDSPIGRMERWRAASITAGMIGPLYDVVQIIRNDAADAAARVDEMEARKGLVQHLCDQIAGMQERITRLEDALEARHKADAEREKEERRFDEEPIPEPPGTVGPSVAVDQHEPTAPVLSGELHSVAAKSGTDELGDLPEELRDLPDPAPEPRGRVVQQPVAISLNKE